MVKTHNIPDEDLIRQAIANQQTAVSRKDIIGIMRCYSDDAVVFNVKPPYQVNSVEDWRRVWETSLSHFPVSFGTEMRDVTISVSGDLAVAHYLLRFSGLPGSQAWIRETVVYKRHRETWKIVHEHSSVPFDPETSKAVFEFE